jgi:hypothetical protein
MQFSQLSLNGCSLTDELILPLRGPTLGVSLYGALLLLLMGP